MANPMWLQVVENDDWYLAPGCMVTVPTAKLLDIAELIQKSVPVLKAGAVSVSWHFKPGFTWYEDRGDGELEQVVPVADMEEYCALIVYRESVIFRFNAEYEGECEASLPQPWVHRVRKAPAILDECPECGDTELWADYFDNDETSAWREVQCQCCFHKWNEVYDFSHNEPR